LQHFMVQRLDTNLQNLTQGLNGAALTTNG